MVIIDMLLIKKAAYRSKTMGPADKYGSNQIYKQTFIISPIACVNATELFSPGPQTAKPLKDKLKTIRVNIEQMLEATYQP